MGYEFVTLRPRADFGMEDFCRSIALYILGHPHAKVQFAAASPEEAQRIMARVAEILESELPNLFPEVV